MTLYVEYICQYCGKLFKKSRKYAWSKWVDGRPTPKKYCSKECVDLARIGKWRGPDACAWRGGTTSTQDIIRKSPAALELRRTVFERDGYKSILSNENGRLVHHHLTAFAILLKKHEITKDNWRDYADILFDPSNAVTLKSEEHKEFHSIYGKVTTPDQFQEYLAAHQARPVE